MYCVQYSAHGKGRWTCSRWNVWVIGVCIFSVRIRWDVCVCTVTGICIVYWIKCTIFLCVLFCAIRKWQWIEYILLRIHLIHFCCTEMISKTVDGLCACVWVCWWKQQLFSGYSCLLDFSLFASSIFLHLHALYTHS